MSKKRKAKKPRGKKPSRKKRSGSEQRKMQPRITFRVDDELNAKVNKDAGAAGLTVGSYIRALLADECSIRPTRRPLPSEIILWQMRARTGHVDGNLAQLLRKVNCGELVETEELQDACKPVANFYRKATELLFEF